MNADDLDKLPKEEFELVGILLSEIYKSHKEGMKSGREMGKTMAQNLIATELLKQKIDPEEIARVTQFSPEVIEEIRRTITY